jgi:hypothetical protein
VFTVVVNGVEQQAIGGKLFQKLGKPLMDVSACNKGCTYHFIMGKTVFVSLRRSPQEATVLEDLALWCVRSGVLSEDELLTRYFRRDERQWQCGKKVFTRSMYMGGIRWVAVSLGLRLDIFFSKVTRQGAATTGQSDAQIRQGRWAPNSYIRSSLYP